MPQVTLLFGSNNKLFQTLAQTHVKFFNCSFEEFIELNPEQLTLGAVIYKKGTDHVLNCQAINEYITKIAQGRILQELEQKSFLKQQKKIISSRSSTRWKATLESLQKV